MKFLGNSLHIANSGKLIARSSQTPTSGGIVFDSNKNKIGKVSYVLGPTKQPYISIRLFKSADYDRIKRNYGEKLFVSKPKSKKRKKRRMKTFQKKKIKLLDAEKDQIGLQEKMKRKIKKRLFVRNVVLQN